jgi:F420-0:gamma-glutamyl ligase
MIIRAIKTRALKAPKDDLLSVIDENVTSLQNGDVLCIASKVVAIHQGRTIPIEDYETRKDEIIEAEAEKTLPREVVPGEYVRLTITQGNLASTAGIDRSNGNGHAILWPKDPTKFASEIRQNLMEKYLLDNFAVIITDSRSQPLRYGTIGYAIGGAGLKPFVEYAEQEDLFGRPFGYQQSNIYDGLSAAATVEMGEGSESTPLAIICELPKTIIFSDEHDFNEVKIPPEEDIYWPLIKDFK